MPSLSHFTLADMTRCTAAVRRLNKDATTPAQRAQRVTQYFFQSFTDREGRQDIALARLFITMPFKDLNASARARAQQYLGPHPAQPDTKCLTLLATTGREPAWNSVQPDSRYLALPLVSEDFLQQWPMFAQLLQQVGLPVTATTQSRMDLLLDTREHAFNVFYVPEAAGSPYVPAQDFVHTWGIRSVIGLGGILPCGAFFVVILFTTVLVPKRACELFKTLTLAVRLALLPSPEEDPDEAWEAVRARSLDQLLDVHEQTVLEQADHLHHSCQRLEDQRAQLRLLTQRLQTAQDEERRRIGHELHDDIVSRLGSAIFDLEVRTKLPNLSQEQLCTGIQEVRRQLKDISLSARGLARTLQPCSLDLLGLSSAVIQHVEEFRARTGINVTLAFNDFRDPPDRALQLCLFRVIQEGLCNVWKHASNAHVVIKLHNEDNTIIMTMVDTGAGFDLGALPRPHTGLGLLNMEERVHLAQGSFLIQSAPGQGTRIHVTLPLPGCAPQP